MTRLPVATAAMLAFLVGCSGDIGNNGSSDTGHSGGSGGAATTTTTSTTSSGGGATSSSSSTSSGGGSAPTDDNAYLHVDLWTTWWNDRTRCGAERAFLGMCKKRGEDCKTIEQAVAACDPNKIVYGQVGPEKQGEKLCRRSKFPDIGGCIAAKHDYAKLHFWWYGAEWQGNWPWATLKVFPKGKDWKGGGELIAISSLPNRKESVMAGIQNHGMGFGCVMKTTSSGDDRYHKPFGGFAWVRVPTDQPVTIAAVAASNFGGQSFGGCHRGNPTQQPWIPGAPGSQLGCVYVHQDVTFAKGKHYLLSYGKLSELKTAGPPKILIDGFALKEVGIDVSQRDNCKL